MGGPVRSGWLVVTPDINPVVSTHIKKTWIYLQVLIAGVRFEPTTSRAPMAEGEPDLPIKIEFFGGTGRNHNLCHLKLGYFGQTFNLQFGYFPNHSFKFILQGRGLLLQLVFEL